MPSDPDRAARERDFFLGRVDLAFTGPEPAAWEARSAAFDGLSAAAWATAAQPTDPRIAGCLATVGQLGVVMLESLRGHAVQVPYRGRLLDVPVGLSLAEFDAGQWADCLFAATAAQDAAAAVRLSRVRVDAFVPGGPPGQTAVAAAVAAVWAGDGDVGPHLVAALERTDPAALPDAEADAALDVVVPQAAVLERIAMGAAPGAALLEAAQRYRHHWARQEPEVFLAVPLCGLAVLARLLGLPVEVADPVLPPAVVDRDPAALLACPVCAEPFDPTQQRCAWCDTDLTADAPLELPLTTWVAARRTPCTQCGALVHPQALRCWSCRTPRG